MARTLKEIEVLKRDWQHDPCWDIETTEGFEEHREELLQFRKKCEAKWEEEYKAREAKIDDEAEKLGVKGIYRLIKKHEELLDRHHNAMEILADGDGHRAYRILNGYQD